MTQYPTHNPSATALMPSEPSLYSRKNFAIFVLEGGLFMSGMTFVSQDSILPGIVRQLGGSDRVLAFIPMLMMMGFTLPPLFTAGWIERKGRLMPILRFFGILQRLPFLLTALVLWGMGSSHPTIALWSVLACPVLSGLMGGITLGAWMRVTSRTVPGKRRSSGTALRNLFAAIMGMFAGVFVEKILIQHPGVQGFALLHGICFVFLVLSYITFLFTEEPHAEPLAKEHHKTFAQQLKGMGKTLKVDIEFRHYIFSRMLASLTFATVPFMAIHVLDMTGNPESFTGRLLSFQMAGAILGNVLGGWMGDRYGSRKVLLCARSSFLTLGILLLTANSETLFCFAFLLWGSTFGFQQIGEQTFLVEFAKDKGLPSYMAIAAFIQLVTVLGVGFLSSTLRTLSGSIWPVLLISMFGVSCSLLLLLFKIKDPRFVEERI